jgi:hypothetical protein
LGLQVAAGLLTCFFGYKLFRSALFWFGFLVGFLLLAPVGYDFALSHSSLAPYAPVVALVAALAGGFVFGKLATFFYRFAVFVTGGVLGLAVAGYLFGGAVGWLAFLIGGILALLFEKPAVVLATAVVGAKTAIDGVLLLNAYLHLVERIEWLSHGERLDLFIKQVERNAHADPYALVWFILSLAGFAFQYLLGSDED